MALDATRKALALVGEIPVSGARAKWEREAAEYDAALAEVAAAERVLETAESLVRNNAYPDELAAALRDLAALKEPA